MKLSIVIPVYNEERTIKQIISAVKAALHSDSFSKEIIVVDDGSTDGTRQLLAEYDGDSEIYILYNEKNSGKSATVSRGLSHSTGDIVLIQDADLEYDPTDFPKLIEPILAGRSDVVYGTRFNKNVQTMKFINKIANKLSTFTVNFLFSTRLSDVNTCYKAFRRDTLDEIQITSSGFTFEMEITAKLLKRGFTICEVPIKYSPRSKREGRKMNWAKAIYLYFSFFKYAF